MDGIDKVSNRKPYDLELHITKTHKYLIRALFQLLEKKSFDRITVKEICDIALVSRSGFYNHFEDKYHLLLFALEELKCELSAELDYNEQTLHLKNLLSYIQSHARLFKSLFNSETTLESRNMLNSVFTDELVEYLTVKQTINKQNFPFSIDVMAIFITGGIIQVIQWWVLNDFAVSQERILEIMMVV